MIELKNIKKTYYSKKGKNTEALKGIDLKFGENGLTFILGKSGSGKSTLLNILGGLDSASSGEMIVNGKSTKNFKAKDWDAYRNTYIGFIFQEFNLLDSYTVEQNIKLSLELQHQKVSSKDVSKALEKVDLKDLLKRKPNELSGGQKQRVAIARALIKNPDVIIADEPTGNLDSTNSEQIFKLLKEMSKEKLIIVVSHDEESAFKYADRIIEIKDGEIKSDNAKEDYSLETKFLVKNAHLPFFYSMKMGLGNLFHKKLKLVFSVLSIVLCLICFGLTSSIMNKNLESELIEDVKKQGGTEFYIEKYDQKVSWNDQVMSLLSGNFSTFEEIFPTAISLDEKDIEKINRDTSLVWNPCYYLYLNGAYTLIGKNDDNEKMYYDSFSISFSTESNFNHESLIGRESQNEKEVVITSYLADSIIYTGTSAKKEDGIEYTYKPTSYQEIVDDENFIQIGNSEYFKVVGILKVDTSKYEELKNITWNEFNDSKKLDSKKQSEIGSLMNQMSAERSFFRIYAKKEYIDSKKDIINTIGEYPNEIIYNEKSYTPEKFGYIKDSIEVYSDKKELVSELQSNQIVLNISALNTITDGDYSLSLAEYLEQHLNASREEHLLSYLKENKIIGSKLSSGIKEGNVYLSEENYQDYEIIGIVMDGNKDEIFYYPKNHVEKLIHKSLELTSVYTYIDDIKTLRKVLNYYPLDNSDMLLSSIYTNNIMDTYLGMVVLSTVGKYGTIIFAILAILLLMGFINTSIRFRKKEIGILRAIGCRSNDILKIFLFECIGMMSICLGISFIILPILCNKINNFLNSTAYLPENLLNFGINQALSVTFVMIALTVISSILPMVKVIKSKPIDVILEKE